MTLEDRVQSYSPHVLSIVRIVVALLFFEHGSAKLLGFPSTGSMPDAFTLIWFAGAIELAGGALLAAGFYTRVSAFVMSGQMAFAYFLSHAPRDFFPILNRGDGAILYCFIFLYIAFAGGGAWSVDNWLNARRGQAVQPTGQAGQRRA